MKNYLEYQDDKSHKFWEITLTSLNLTTRYGKIITNGQVSKKLLKPIKSRERI